MKNNDYNIYDFYGKAYPDEHWDGRLARKKLNELINIKQERLNQLCSLVHNLNLELDYTTKSLQGLNDFVCQELKKFIPNLDKANPKCCEYAEIPYFRSLAIDSALYLGEMLIKKFPNLKWDVYKTNSKYDGCKFYPSINNYAITMMIYIYIVQYLGSHEDNTKYFSELFNELKEELENA